jgi:hypothetical protein
MIEFSVGVWIFWGNGHARLAFIVRRRMSHDMRRRFFDRDIRCYDSRGRARRV